MSAWWGDLHHSSPSWKFLTQCYELGIVAGTLTGTPCETFSEARFTQPVDSDHRRWPRPLRSADQLYGLPGLSMRELAQLQMGSNFFLQGLEALASHLCSGGVFLSEHPGLPRDPDRPTTWRAPLTMLLRAHTAVSFGQSQQFEYGAPAVKPTGLLSCRLPGLFRILKEHALPRASRPTEPAIGLGPDGEFKTSRLKECPPRLCQAFARVFCEHFRTAVRTRHFYHVPAWDDPAMHSDLKQWLIGAASASKVIRTSAPWLPDFQCRVN